MSKRTLIILLIVFIVLVALVVGRSRTSVKSPGEGVKAAALVLPGLDVNQVAGLKIAAGVAEVKLGKKAGRWVVSSLYDYPADFVKLAEFLRDLSDLRIGQTIRGGTEQLEEFGLGEGKEKEKQPTIIRLFDQSGGSIAQISLGIERLSSSRKGFAGYSEGRYLRVADGPVILVRDSFGGLSSKSDDWISHGLLTISSPELEEVSLTLPSGTYTLRVKGANNYEMDGLQPDEKLNTGSASRMVRTAQRLRCTTVADPALKDKELGMEEPSRLVLKTKNGFQYALLIGAKVGDEGGRYLRIDAAYERPAPPTLEEVEKSLPPPAEATPSPAAPPSPALARAPATKNRAEQIKAEYDKRLQEYESKCAADAKKVEELKAGFQGWTYLISTYDAESLTLPRDQMVKKETARPAEQTEGQVNTGEQ